MGWFSKALGAQNSFDPTDPDQVHKVQGLAPQNTFQATGANLPKQNYGAGIDATMGRAGENYGQQQSFIDSLRGAADGTGGPSAAAGMLNQATGRNIQNVASAAASNKSLSPAQQARMAIEGGVAAQGEAAGQAATLRANEQLGARSLLGSALATQGGQNIANLSTLMGGEQGQNALSLQNALGTQGINAQVGGQNAGLQLGQQQLAAGVGAGNASTNAGVAGGVLNAVGGAFGLSDERAKADVVRLKSEALPGVKEAQFRYKSEPKGTQHRGVIAQDVEKKYPALVKQSESGLKMVPASLMKYAGGGRVPLFAGAAIALPEILGEMGGADAMSSTGATSAAMTKPAGAGAGAANMGKNPLKDILPNMTAGFTAAAQGGENEMQRLLGMHLAGSTYSQGGKVPPVHAYLDSLYGAGTSAAPLPPEPQLQHSLTGSMYAAGGRVPALVSPQEVVVPPAEAHDPRAAARFVAEGKGKVPGKAKVKGDARKNDTVRRELRAGSVVIPRSVTQSDRPAARTASFVASLGGRAAKRYFRGGRVVEG